MKPKAQSSTITIPEVRPEVIHLRIVGLSPLLTDRFGEDKIDLIERKQTGEHSSGRKPRNPTEEYESSKYRVKLGGKLVDCVPSMMFKGAMVQAAPYCDGLNMKLIKGAVFPIEEFTPLKFKLVRMHRSMGKNAGVSAGRIPRYRAEYVEWSCTLSLRFDPSALSKQNIAGLLNLAGTRIGIGNWRPQSGRSGGFHGMYRVS